MYILPVHCLHIGIFFHKRAHEVHNICNSRDILGGSLTAYRVD